MDNDIFYIYIEKLLLTLLFAMENAPMCGHIIINSFAKYWQKLYLQKYNILHLENIKSLFKIKIWYVQRNLLCKQKL
jgi:hypothetical protein